ncbi:MAG: hypothetical protein QM778_05845 [Myxococcales bacterium]
MALAHDPVVVVQQPPVPVGSTTIVLTPGEPVAPSLLSQGARGFFAGSLTGLAIGYLSVRGDGVQRDDWRPLLTGSIIGALVGTGLGVAVGALDYDGRGWGQYVMRDLLLGVTLGAALGASCGGLAALNTESPEAALIGTAVGTIAGAGVGIVTGVLQGQLRRPARGVQANLGVARDVSGSPVWTPGVHGRF